MNSTHRKVCVYLTLLCEQWYLDVTEWLAERDRNEKKCWHFEQSVIKYVMSSRFNQTHQFLVNESAIVGDSKQHDSSEIIIFAYFKCTSTAEWPESSRVCKLKHEICHCETNGTQTAISPQKSTFCIFSKRRLITAIPICTLNKGMFVM